MSIVFDRAEYQDAQPAAALCTACDQQVAQSYYEIGGKIICSPCREARDRALDGWGLVRFLRAAAAGSVVGIAGAVVWWGVRVLTGYEIGIISIFIGIGVGRAVHWGARGKGGWLYQLLALFLTYTAIVTNYVPDIARGMSEPAAPSLFHYIAAFFVSYAAPFLMGVENIIGMLIIAFGLWEAWKINRRVDVAITGPYTVTPAPMPVAANV